MALVVLELEISRSSRDFLALLHQKRTHYYYIISIQFLVLVLDIIAILIDA